MFIYNSIQFQVAKNMLSHFLVFLCIELKETNRNEMKGTSHLNTQRCM